MSTDTLACWRCELPGHAAAECAPPPAKTRKELAARIARYVERWQENEISLTQKRAWIQAETRAYEKEKAK